MTVGLCVVCMEHHKKYCQVAVGKRCTTRPTARPSGAAPSGARHLAPDSRCQPVDVSASVDLAGARSGRPVGQRRNTFASFTVPGEHEAPRRNNFASFAVPGEHEATYEFLRKLSFRDCDDPRIDAVWVAMFMGCAPA